MSIVIAMAAIAIVFSALYNSVQQNVWMRGELNAMQYAQEFDLYLMLGTNSVKTTSYSVDKLIKGDASNKEIPSRAGIARAVGARTEHAQATLYDVLEKLTDADSKSAIHEFTDLSTLDERMEGCLSRLHVPEQTRTRQLCYLPRVSL